MARAGREGGRERVGTEPNCKHVFKEVKSRVRITNLISSPALPVNTHVSMQMTSKCCGTWQHRWVQQQRWSLAVPGVLGLAGTQAQLQVYLQSCAATHAQSSTPTSLPRGIPGPKLQEQRILICTDQESPAEQLLPFPSKPGASQLHLVTP